MRLSPEQAQARRERLRAIRWHSPMDRAVNTYSDERFSAFVRDLARGA